jgi:transposase
VGARPAAPRRGSGHRGESGDPDGDRDLAAFRDFVYSDLHGTVVVHGRYVNYNSFDGITRQLCCQQLLRDLEDAAQIYPHAIWPGQTADALRALIHQANLARDQGMTAVPADTTAEHLTLFRRGVTVGLSEVRRVPGKKAKQAPARTRLECLRHREADVLRFLTDTAIPPDQQPGRTRPRPSKTKQKISGRLRSEKTTRHRYAIRGYASTTRKHGVAVFTAIRDALTGNPWMPPLPAALNYTPNQLHIATQK